MSNTQSLVSQTRSALDSTSTKLDKLINILESQPHRFVRTSSKSTASEPSMPHPVAKASNSRNDSVADNNYNGYGNGGYGKDGYDNGGYGYNGYGSGHRTILEREKALKREKEEWVSYWKRKEEELRKEQKKFEEQKWNWTGELWQKAARLNVREEGITKHEKKLAKREVDLEEEKVKVLEQYKRAKKLERQGKRREERIEKAQQHLQYQVNEHFSIVYTTLQLGLKSRSLSTQTFSESSRSASSPSELIPSSRSPDSIPFTDSQAKPRFLKPAGNHGKPFLKFGKPKDSTPTLASPQAPSEITVVSERHSSCACHPTDEDEFDKKATTSIVEAVNFVSTQQDPFRGKTSVIDRNASLINVNIKKLNGKHYADDEDTSTFVSLCTTLFPSGSNTTSLPRVNKHNPHVDWGPRY